MTLLPTDPVRIRRAPADIQPIDEFPNECSNPACNNQPQDMHHIVRRSYAGNNTWVMIDNTIIPNVCGLCRPCHDLLTLNKARIVYEAGDYYWSDDKNGIFAQLSPHPTYPADKPGVSFGTKNYSPQTGVCPTCERPLPKPREEQEPTRERRTWTVTVPKDKRENGAEVLDTLLEEIRLEFSKAGLEYGEAPKVRYFILSTALGLFVQSAQQILSDA